MKKQLPNSLKSTKIDKGALEVFRQVIYQTSDEATNEATSKTIRHSSVKSSERPTSLPKSESTDEDEVIREILPIMKTYTGLIIGNKGTTIKKFQDDTYTKMRIIDWNEEKAVLI